MLALIGECKTTEQISYETGEPLDVVRPNIVRLRHLGIIEPIAICVYDDEFPGRISYFDNLMWELTEHGKHHDQSQPNCRACWFREKLMLDVTGLIE